MNSENPQAPSDADHPPTPPALDPDAGPEDSPEEVRPFASAVVALWALVIVGLLAHLWFGNHSHTVISTYRGAGQHWLDGQPLYEGTRRRYVYSPLVAAFFAPFAKLPFVLSESVWFIVSVGAYVGSIGWALRSRFFPQDGNGTYPLVLLLLLPLSIGNLSNAQVNPLVTALLLGGIVAVKEGRMNLGALLIAGAAYFKIYPVALGMVLMVAYPRQFSWRYVLALAALAGLSFVLQHPTYVATQYALWFSTRLSDNRLEYDIDVAPRDLWMILKLLRAPISEHFYMGVQVLTGAAIAGLVVLGRFRLGWTDRRTLVAAYCLVGAWMLLCGPATESATYVMLAPAVAFALVQSYEQEFSPALRRTIFSAYVVLMLAQIINSFLHLKKSPWVMSVQPIGCLLFTGFAITWVIWAWKSGPQALPPRRPLC